MILHCIIKISLTIQETLEEKQTQDHICVRGSSVLLCIRQCHLNIHIFKYGRVMIFLLPVLTQRKQTERELKPHEQTCS